MHGREVCRNWWALAPPPDFWRLKSLIFIGVPQIYNLSLLCPPPSDFYATSRLCEYDIKSWLMVEQESWFSKSSEKNINRKCFKKFFNFNKFNQNFVRRLYLLNKIWEIICRNFRTRWNVYELLKNVWRIGKQ